MKIFLLTILCFSAISVSGQNYLDTLMIDHLLLSSYPKNAESNVDPRIIKTIQSFDNYFLKILGNYSTYAKDKFTIIAGDAIMVKKLKNKDELLNAIFTDTTQSTSSFNYKTFWGKFSNDTVAFLSNPSVVNNFELYYPDSQYPNDIEPIIPELFSDKLKLKNVIFYSESINQKIGLVAKQLNRKQKTELWKYLEKKINYFYPSKKRLSPASIRITDIAFGVNDMIYVGADIYGGHYLLTFNKNEDYMYQSKKAIWVY